MTDAERVNRLECQLISALHHIRQLLLSERPACEVAWWLRANHSEYMADTSEDRRAALSALADQAEESLTPEDEETIERARRKIDMRACARERRIEKLELALHQITGHGNITGERARKIAAEALNQ